jgi:hypothetical protein
VTKSARRKYIHEAPGANIRVFCVGNDDYTKHRGKPRNDALRYLNLSGIIDLRRFCVSIVSESQHRSALLYMQDRIPDIVAHVDLWVQKHAEGEDSALRPAVRQILDTIQTRLQTVSNLERLVLTWMLVLTKSLDRIWIQTGAL